MKVSAKNHQLDGDTGDAHLNMPTSPKAKKEAAPLKQENMLFTHIGALYMKRLNYGRRDGRAICCSLVAPIVMFLLGALLLTVTNKSSYYPSLQLSSSMFAQKSLPTAYSCAPSTDTASCNTIISNMPDITAQAVDITAVPNPVTMFSFTYNTANYVYQSSADVVKMADAAILNAPLKPPPFQFGSYLLECDGTAANKQTLATIGVNASGLLSAPFFTSEYHNALYKVVTGSSASILVSSHPLPATYNASATVSNFTVTLFAMIAMAFIPATTIFFVVRERDHIQNSKHLQLVSGASLTSYWVANFLWDFTLYLFTLAAMLIIMGAFKMTSFVGCTDQYCLPNVLLSTFLLFALYGLAVAPFSYLFSFIFSQPTLAQSLQLFFAFITGLIGMIATEVMDQISTTVDTSKALKWILWMLPPYALGNGLLNLVGVDGTGRTSPPTNVLGNVVTTPFDLDVTGKNLIYMAACAVFYLALTILIDYVLVQSSLRTLFGAKSSGPGSKVFATEPDEDDDVAAERLRVSKCSPDDELVLLNELHKKYDSGKVAVRNLSFGLQAGTCFGFLGINGGETLWQYDST